ncbi:MAG: hypothetical protein ABJN84_15075 [Flavobacteriaceae bacterium]
MKYGFFVGLIIGTLFFSCKNDDDLDVEVIEASLLSEVAPEDDAEIKEFLQTHFYNYEEFETPPADFDYKIRIDTIAGDNADKTALIDMVDNLKSASVNVSSDAFGLDDGEEDVAHTYYYLEARVGGGGSPTYADSTLLRYRGTLLDGTLFDENQTFSWQELPFTIRGYAQGISNFHAGTEDQIVENGDGTIEIANSGVGMFILPSGLAYFNSTPSILIPTYSILLFEVEIGAFIEDTDNDNDGVPSILEDLNGDGNLNNDDTDEEDEINNFGFSVPNFQDADDDGDGVSTNDEITDDDGNIILPYPDSNNDGTPDYLDPDTN